MRESHDRTRQGTEMAEGETKAFFGKYRGRVVDNVDPMSLGRIIVEAPAIQGASLNWAMPCSPYAGPGVGLYAIPPIGANIWVEFENGDTDRPIWTGCFWAEGELPQTSRPLGPETKVFKTEYLTMIFDNLPEAGGFLIRCAAPATDISLSITADSSGMTLAAAGTTVQLTQEILAVIAQAVSLNGNTQLGAVTAATGPSA